MRLNLGCGIDYLDGYKNIDISKAVRADEYYDIRDGIKEDNCSVDEILMNGVLEQVADNHKFVFVLNECHRVLDDDGVFKGQVPSTDHRVLCLDPFDRRWFLPETFYYFDINRTHWEKFGKQYGFLPWKNITTNINNGGIITFSMTPYRKDV